MSDLLKRIDEISTEYDFVLETPQDIIREWEHLMQTEHQLMIRDALISARERFRLMIEGEVSVPTGDYAVWAIQQAEDGLKEADKALSTPEPEDKP